jgi:hypothetical protein
MHTGPQNHSSTKTETVERGETIMVKKMKMRCRATSSLYLIESRDAERKLREARNIRKKRAKKLLPG